MTYYPDPNPKKPNGCLETLVLTKIAFEVLLPAVAFIFGSILAIVFIIWAFATSVWLGLFAVGLAALAIWLLTVWDKRRVAKIEAEIKDLNLPPPDVGRR